MTDPLLITFLAERDASCPRCHYSLRDLTTDRCPECGLELQLAVKSAKPLLGAWIAALLGTAIPGGFNITFCTFLLVSLLVDPRSFYWDQSMLATIIPGVVAALTLPALLIWRTAFLRCSIRRRWLIGSLSTGAQVAPLLWLFIFE